MSERIDRALKILDRVEIRTQTRDGKICKIPAQKIELPVKHGIKVIYEVIEDINE